MRPWTLLFSLFILVHCANAQSFSTPVEYMDYIYKQNHELTQKYLTYLSAVSHGKSARKVERRRAEVLDAITNTRYNINGMPPYKGDRSLKDTMVAYLKLLNYIFNDQYGKIVNMEEIAEQSYDAMEAYLLAQEKANEKLEEAWNKQSNIQKQFAAKNNIDLVESEDATSLKMKQAGEVMKHADEVYLVFFKCNKQEAYLFDAMNKKNLVSIEQNISSLQKFAEQGLDKLKGLKGYNNDGSLIEACRELMDFYKMETEKSSGISDYFLKEEDFKKLKKQFDALPQSRRTQQDIDKYNKAVNELNESMDHFNKTNKDLDKKRNTLVNNWDKVYKKYMDQHMPVHR